MIATIRCHGCAIELSIREKTFPPDGWIITNWEPLGTRASEVRSIIWRYPSAPSVDSVDRAGSCHNINMQLWIHQHARYLHACPTGRLKFCNNRNQCTVLWGVNMLAIGPLLSLWASRSSFLHWRKSRRSDVPLYLESIREASPGFRISSFNAWSVST